MKLQNKQRKFFLTNKILDTGANGFSAKELINELKKINYNDLFFSDIQKGLLSQTWDIPFFYWFFVNLLISFLFFIIIWDILGYPNFLICFLGYLEISLFFGWYIPGG